MGSLLQTTHTKHEGLYHPLCPRCCLPCRSCWPPAYGAEPAYPDEPALYTYNFAVKDDYSNNNFGTEEKRDGYAAQGSYYVSLPDGRLQKVAYSVNGEGGYVADVTYEGEAQYPPVKAYVPAAAPAYAPAA
eukprot:TRINITY_DN1564_c0_g1_i2.p1 TRINITY_DN1564_c0_g1~~TRINITY_DN1564_c0_g1_i2.p1  ORF type:complete len:139 (-),score=39.73 TRINITY_DN1564_c0_g1_i2:160-552(-)